MPVVCLTKSPLKMLANSTRNRVKSFGGGKIGDQRRKFHQIAIADEISSPRENYFRAAGHFVRQVFNALSDILIPCQTFFSVDNRQILNPAGQSVRQGQSPLLDISKTRPDMSGIFREDCEPTCASCKMGSYASLSVCPSARPFVRGLT